MENKIRKKIVNKHNLRINDQRRIAHNVLGLAKDRILCTVHRANPHYAVHSLSELTPRGRQCVTMRAECGVEIDEPQLVRVRHLFVEVGTWECDNLRVIIVNAYKYQIIMFLKLKNISKKTLKITF